MYTTPDITDLITIPAHYDNSWHTISPPPASPRCRSPYIKGPIDLPWILAVERLPGKVPLVLALAIQFQWGLTKNPAVKLTRKLLTRFDLKPRSVHDAIRKLEEAGLITVERRKGCCHCVRQRIPDPDPPTTATLQANIPATIKPDAPEGLATALQTQR